MAARSLRVSPIELVSAGLDWLHVGIALANAESVLSEHQNRPRKTSPPSAAQTLGRA